MKFGAKPITKPDSQTHNWSLLKYIIYEKFSYEMIVEILKRFLNTEFMEKIDAGQLFFSF